MLFIPYKADLDATRIPFLTILVCLLCIGIMYMQYDSNAKTWKAIENFCQVNSDTSFRMKLKNLTGESDRETCEVLIYTHLHADDAEQQFDELIENSKQVPGFSKTDSREYLRQAFEEKFRLIESRRVKDITEEMVYYPNDYNVKRMFASSIAHGDWGHLFGNLFFFFAFAASVEILLGSGRFLLLFSTLCIGTSLAYSMFANPETNIPTLGLSGVVMGMIGIFAYLMPTVKIRCFFWFLMFIRFFSIPAWILAIWFIGWDIYGQLVLSETSNTNFISHLSGAAIGFLFGLLFLRRLKEEVAPS